MTQSVAPFLMFEDGKAQEAIDFYISVVPNSEIVEMQRYGDSNPDNPELIMFANVSIGGQMVYFHDTTINHGFTFTPSWSLFIECDSESEADELAAALVEQGEYLMPPGDYGFGRRFAWPQDRFGVSWQVRWK